ncbi:hypothetical protein [Hyphomonas sp.]|uniref:hypothetical protein n=1 Tax=Hyphomonas sp. TaxID=87 RepID=UPI0039187D12
MHGLRTPLCALGLCLLMASPVHAQLDDAPSAEAPSAWDETGVDAADAGEFDSSPKTDLAALDRAHAAYLADRDLQLERPEQEFEPPVLKPPPRWLQAFGDFLQALGPVFQFIFWAALALVVAGILYFLFGEAIRLRFGGRAKPKDRPQDDILPDLRPDAAAARSLLEEADALARQGRFAEAVHLLLFRSIEDIQDRLEGGVPVSLTAREISSLGRLPDRAKRALGPIIQVVERSFFGGRPVDAEGWREARSSYETFAFGEGWT